MISVPLFFSRFSTRIRFATRIHRGLGDRPVHGVEAASAISPCSIMIIGLSPDFGATVQRLY